MSYSTVNILEKNVRLTDVIEFIDLLDYKYSRTWRTKELGGIGIFYWFDNEDYKSWLGIELSIYIKNNRVHIETTTSIGRSYYDLEQQNRTIRLLRKHFGGIFITDEGKGRYLRPASGPPEPSESGSHLAFNRFGSNLIRVGSYLESRTFKGKQNSVHITWLDDLHPKFLSNILILPFLVSILEDFWKSVYVALFKYSNNKEAFLKGNKIFADRLAQISRGEISLEEGFADSISFARISVVCNHFKTLDKQLDFEKVLKKPYRRRKKSLFVSLEEMTDIRNTIIHEASKHVRLEDNYVQDSINIIYVSVKRCYDELIRVKNWSPNEPFGKFRFKHLGK